jgi:hypothetical protein
VYRKHFSAAALRSKNPRLSSSLHGRRSRPTGCGLVKIFLFLEFLCPSFALLDEQEAEISFDKPIVIFSYLLLAAFLERWQ